MVLVQKWPFFQLFFLDTIGQENVFYDILDHGFGQKMAIFELFFKGNIVRENVFYDILERKYPFGKMSVF